MRRKKLLFIVICVLSLFFVDAYAGRIPVKTIKESFKGAKKLYEGHRINPAPGVSYTVRRMYRLSDSLHKDSLKWIEYKRNQFLQYDTYGIDSIEYSNESVYNRFVDSNIFLSSGSLICSSSDKDTTRDSVVKTNEIQDSMKGNELSELPKEYSSLDRLPVEQKTPSVLVFLFVVSIFFFLFAVVVLVYKHLSGGKKQ